MIQFPAKEKLASGAPTTAKIKRISKSQAVPAAPLTPTESTATAPTEESIAALEEPNNTATSIKQAENEAFFNLFCKSKHEMSPLAHHGSAAQDERQEEDATDYSDL
ncbi:hypothetical protein BGZ70_009973, partial [Mortierella alpina]